MTTMIWSGSVRIGAGAIVALVVSTGCSSGNGGSEQAAQPAPATPSATAAPADQDHNQADAMFAQHMIPHHQQAIEMSDIVLAKQGMDPRVTDLAKQIKAAQGPEIDQMRSWLSQWGNPPMPAMTPGEGQDSHDMGDMPGMSGGTMGMMSGEEMTALKNAAGIEASRLFLTGMITHHEGAIDMAQNEIKDGRFAPAIDLSRSIVTTQQREIDTMKGILETL